MVLSLMIYDRALPALTIHTAVAQSRRFFAKATSPRVKTWGPTFTGLALVPILPYLFDEPVEYATDRAFGWIRDFLIERSETTKRTGIHEKQDL